MKTILYVDDDPHVLTATQRKLRPYPEWELTCAQGSHAALHKLVTEHIDAVVTDVAMPGMSGLELLQHIQHGAYGFIPVVVVTGFADSAAKRKALEYGAQDLLSKPVDTEDLVARLRSALALKSYHDELAGRNAYLEDLVVARTEELASSRFELVVQLAKAAEMRDLETGDHVLRVGGFARLIALELGLERKVSDEICIATCLHDVGKIAIPDAVLRKGGALDKKERELIKSHCAIGYDILMSRENPVASYFPGLCKLGEQSSIIQLAASIARSHHEWWDGTGYPDGLSGEQIPLPARIAALADVLDALRSERPYKPAYDWDTAVCMIEDGRGTQFDPTVLDALKRASASVYDFDLACRDPFTLEAAA